MITLNLQNVEELVFFNKAVQRALPEFSNTFSTWALGKRVPSLRFLCQKAIFEFFNELTDEHTEKLSAILKDNIKIVTTDPHLVKTAIFDLDCAGNAILMLVMVLRIAFITEI